MQQIIQDLNIFDLEASFADLIKNVLPLGAVDNNYSEEIIYIHIFFLVQLLSL